MPQLFESHSSEPDPSDADFGAPPTWSESSSSHGAAAGIPSFRSALDRGTEIPRELLKPERRRDLLSYLLAYRSDAIASEVARQLRQRSVLLDAATISARVAGVVAARLEDSDTFEATLQTLARECIDTALEEVLAGSSSAVTSLGEFTLLGSTAAASAVCREFNRLGDADRATLFRLAVLGEGPASVAAALGAPIPTILESARRALVRIEGSIESPASNDPPAPAREHVS
jgi:hypothetical protein